MTAALYSKRMGKSVLLLEGENYGGQITASPRVENYPAIKALSGSEFADSLLDQILSLGVETEYENAVKLRKTDYGFSVVTDSKTYLCKSVIIASGCSHRRLDVEKCGNVKSGISYCAVCDGIFYKDKIVAVAGGGDTALNEALYLSAICSKVYIIHRRDCLRGCISTVERLKKQSNVEFVLNGVISDIKGGQALEGIEITDTVSGTKKDIALSGLFVAIGMIPRTEIFKDTVKTDNSGFIISGEDCKTSEEGIFAAGDCRTKALRQLITSVSDGGTAAINACNYIDGKK